jgi:hypothetical protein
MLQIMTPDVETITPVEEASQRFYWSIGAEGRRNSYIRFARVRDGQR